MGIGEIVTSKDPDDVLVAYGLGSCVAVCLYDRQASTGGMLHALLPAAPDSVDPQSTASKFARQGIPLLIDAVVRLGANRSRLVVQLFGGAHMLSAPGFKNSLNIGERNVETAKDVLKAAGLQIRAEATGGQIGRTVRLHIADGKVIIKARGQEEKIIDR